MKIKASMVVQYVFGGILILFGLNGFFEFLPIPDQTIKGKLFITALYKTGYLIYTVKALEVIVGIALILRKFVPLALITIVPITVNIFLYHLFLDKGNIVIGIIMIALNGYLLFENKKYYLPLLKS